MRPLRVAAGVLALSLALVAAVAARDVGRADDRIRAGDVRFAQRGVFVNAWRDADRPLVRVPDAVLGIDDDLRLRRALLLVRASHVTDDPSVDAWTLARLHSQAEEAMLRYVRGGADARRRALAANALGVLFYEDSLVARSSAGAFTQRSLESFRRAIRLDPTAATPKANLELLLSLVRRNTERRRSGGGGSGSDARRSGGMTGSEGY